MAFNFENSLKSVVVVPVAFIMGGIANCGRCPAVWVGGEPNATWTGLEDPNATCVDSAQLGSVSLKSYSKPRPDRQVHSREKKQSDSRRVTILNTL